MPDPKQRRLSGPVRVAPINLQIRHRQISQSISATLGLCVFLVLLTACGQSESADAPVKDSWYRAIDNPAHEFYELPPFLFAPVREELVPEAAAALGDGPLLQLSPSEAVRYAQNRLRTMRELRPFLIHGLYRQQRVFSLLIADRALWVDSHDDPHETTPTKRQPLVIYIDEVPPDVYVTTGAARSNIESATPRP